MTITNNIFDGKLDEATQGILGRLRTTLAERVEDALYPAQSLDEQIQALNAQLAVIEESAETQDTVSRIKGEIQELEDMNNGFIFEATGDDPERDAVNEIRVRARMSGGGELAYEEGAMYVEFRNKQAASDFADWLETDATAVFGYEIALLNNDTVEGYEDDAGYDFSQITDDRNFHFGFTIYLDPELVQYDDYEVEVDDYEEINEENGELNEVIRKVKINFRGKKRIKMKCRRGFKWDAAKKTCIKITGSQLAKMRKSLRRAVLTKRSKGTAFKARVLRKTRKAKRFRRMMGLKA